jgi:signal transduction histidine kinase
MRRLYLRIYLAVLVSLVAFALVAGALWRHLGDGRGYAFEVAGVLAQNVLPPADAPASDQQAALERLAANLQADVALFAADRTPLAADGRWLVGRVRPEHRPTTAPLFLTLGLLALAVGVGAYPVVRRLTKRLERLQAGVESLGAGDLSSRVPVEGRDEVARLAESFNRAAGRIEELLGAHKSLLAHASHELRTPLTRIRMAVELLKTDADPRRKLDLERDIAELDALIEEILLASRLDAVATLEVDEDVDLLALASEECARYEQTALEGRPVTVRGDPRLLRRMIRNLLENARRHGAPPIDVRVRHAGGSVELTVCDHGPGIPEAEGEDVFRPFHRVGGRAATAGAGLGLALVRQIARRHGGEARYLGRVRSASCFAVSLPAVPGPG